MLARQLGPEPGSLTVTNSTFSGNSADFDGGMSNETGMATLKNTIVANSPSGGDCGRFVPLTDGGYNLVEDGSCITKVSSRSGDPNLGTLADSGGPTKTHALLATSPAIDQGNSFGEITDQRGQP